MEVSLVHDNERRVQPATRRLGTRECEYPSPISETHLLPVIREFRPFPKRFFQPFWQIPIGIPTLSQEFPSVPLTLTEIQHQRLGREHRMPQTKSRQIGRYPYLPTLRQHHPLTLRQDPVHGLDMLPFQQRDHTLPTLRYLHKRNEPLIRPLRPLMPS